MSRRVKPASAARYWNSIDTDFLPSRVESRPPPLLGAPLPWPRRFPLSLMLALCAYLCLAALTVRSVGVVGEVALSAGWLGVLAVGWLVD